jgi:hypothetical protein
MFISVVTLVRKLKKRLINFGEAYILFVKHPVFQIDF